mgnify:CR=1 FL=1
MIPREHIYPHDARRVGLWTKTTISRWDLRPPDSASGSFSTLFELWRARFQTAISRRPCRVFRGSSGAAPRLAAAAQRVPRAPVRRAGPDTRVVDVPVLETLAAVPAAAGFGAPEGAAGPDTRVVDVPVLETLAAVPADAGPDTRGVAGPVRADLETRVGAGWLVLASAADPFSGAVSGR